MALPAGTGLGHFEVVSPIGSGGMGEVYKAHDTRPDRIVAIKVLAKAFATDTTAEDPSNSPTLSMNPTMQGVIMGTAAYMSPEQAKSKHVDKRTDIFVFGCDSSNAVAASSASSTYSACAQNAFLTATVTSTGGTVNAGSASVNYALPSHTTAKSYTIQATYNTGSGTSDVADSNHQLTVNQASLTVTGITANSKTYDGTTTATLNMGSAALVDVGSGDTMTLNTASYAANFGDKNVAIYGLEESGPIRGLVMELVERPTLWCAMRRCMTWFRQQFDKSQSRLFALRDYDANETRIYAVIVVFAVGNASSCYELLSLGHRQ